MNWRRFWHPFKARRLDHLERLATQTWLTAAAQYELIALRKFFRPKRAPTDGGGANG